MAHGALNRFTEAPLPLMWNVALLRLFPQAVDFERQRIARTYAPQPSTKEVRHSLRFESPALGALGDGDSPPEKKQPSKEHVRTWLTREVKAHRPPESIEEIRRKLGWELKEPKPK